MRQFNVFLSIIVLILSSCNFNNTSYPNVIRVSGGKLHIQGLVLDQEKKYIYCSFTSAFYKCDLAGNIVGSITGINGHLGALTYDAEARKVYASLEYKDDVIGKNIAQVLGKEEYERGQSSFYIAEIDVDKVNNYDIPFDDVVTLHKVNEATTDYEGRVVIEGVELKHRYGCSGIDGIAIAPDFGTDKNNEGENLLYVAYGIYGDTSRVDNDYNVILSYKLTDFSAPIHKYFVYTGNTTFGVQNMMYDEYTNNMYLAVYKGQKSEFPNYTLFAINMHQTPFFDYLKNVPYEIDQVEQLYTTEAWHFKWGSTGFDALGTGLYYISENGNDAGTYYSDITLYQISDNPQIPFIKCEQ